MPIIVDHHAVVGDLASEIARLEALLADLERIGSGNLPTPAELAQAPLLDPFGFGTRELPCLIGGNHGHPLLCGPVIKTTELWAFAPALGWARTLSRFYRLGRIAVPGGDGQPTTSLGTEHISSD